MRNSLEENRATQTENMMDAHSESQPMSSMNVSNNGFTNMGRIGSARENIMQHPNSSQRSRTAGQSFISSENNGEGQSEQTIRYGSNLNSRNALSLPDISVKTPSHASYQNNISPLNSVNMSGGSSVSLSCSHAQPAVSAQWMMTSRLLLFPLSDLNNVWSEEYWKGHA